VRLQCRSDSAAAPQSRAVPTGHWAVPVPDFDFKFKLSRAGDSDGDPDGTPVPDVSRVMALSFSVACFGFFPAAAGAARSWPPPASGSTRRLLKVAFTQWKSCS
jgi:hypothetical protein